MSYKIKLTYFKQTGKYYSEGSYLTEKEQMFEISDEIKKMKNENKLPEISGSEWIIYVDADNHPNGYPLLIL